MQNILRSCCLCVFLFLHSFWLPSPSNSPCSSRKNYRVHCLSSCIFRNLSSLKVWFITVLRKHLHPEFFPRCTIKASACKNTRANLNVFSFIVPISLSVHARIVTRGNSICICHAILPDQRQRHRNLPYSETSLTIS